MHDNTHTHTLQLLALITQHADVLHVGVGLSC